MSQEETYLYGVVVLVSCWVPAFVVIIHMISYYRENYSAKLGIFFLQILILFICYPLGPFISFCLNLWRFNVSRKNKKLGKIEQMINLGGNMFSKRKKEFRLKMLCKLLKNKPLQGMALIPLYQKEGFLNASESEVPHLDSLLHVFRDTWCSKQGLCP